MRRCTKLMPIFFVVAWLGTANRGQAQEVLPPSSEQNYFAVCYDQYGQIVPYCDVTMGTGVFVYSNGHQHDDPSHPWSSLSPTGGNTGCCGLPYTLYTTIVGQQEWSNVCAAGGCSTYNYAVGYLDLSFVSANSLWVLTGGNTTNHGDNNFNHWATSGLSTGIYNTASQFLQNHPEVGQIALNDMGLPIGGKFDITIPNNWMSPHADHDRGGAVDVNAVPTSMANEFVSLCYGNGATFAQPESNPYHIHCRW